MTRRLVLLPLLVVLALPQSVSLQVAAAEPVGAELLREDVRFANGDTPLAATLLRTPGDQRRPGVVIVHGSGTSDRSNEWTTAWAEALARSGLVVLYPDKRGSGESGGDWLSASFEMLADDAAAGVRLLRDRPDVDPALIGAFGFSQGGYVVPLVALREPACRLVAVVSGGVRPLLDQVVDELALEAESEKQPLSAEDEDAVRDAYRNVLLAAQGRLDWDEARRLADAARARNAAVQHALRTLPDGPAHPALGWVRLVGEFDPLPGWAALTQPALFVYGDQDSRVRVKQSVERLWTLPSGRRDVVLLGGNGHTLFRPDAVALAARWFTDGGAN